MLTLNHLWTNPAVLMLPPVLLYVENDNDRAFLTSVYQDYRNLMYKVALSFFPQSYDEAEDAFSATLEKMCRNPGRLRDIPSSSLASYIATMTANTCRDRLRQLKRGSNVYSMEGEMTELLEDPKDPYEMLFESHSLSDVLISWKGLSDKDRDMLHMRYVEEKSVPEIAMILSIRERAVYSALFRARRHLQELLKQEVGANED